MKPSLRVGIGFDFHRFVEDRKLVLGGVSLEHPLGLEGHSDADVLLHAVIDALLGAAGFGDIGAHFPDTDNRYQGISSLELLQEAYSLVRKEGFRVVNLDLVVLAEEPKIGPYAAEIRSNLSDLLEVGPEDVGVKATTMEKSGVIGRGEGIAVQAVVLINREASNQGQGKKWNKG